MNYDDACFVLANDALLNVSPDSCQGKYHTIEKPNTVK